MACGGDYRTSAGGVVVGGMMLLVAWCYIRKHNIYKIEASKSLKRVRRTQSLGKNRMITLLDKQGKKIQE